MGPGPVQAQVARVENQARRRIPSRKRTMNRHRPLLPSHLLTLLSPHYPPGGLFPSTNSSTPFPTGSPINELDRLDEQVWMVEAVFSRVGGLDATGVIHPR
jgi:hypothetical protein